MCSNISQGTEPFHVTLLLHQWDLLNPACDLKQIKAAGITHITLPLMWRKIESEQGLFEFSFYDDLAQRIANAGLGLILLLDAGGRWNFDDEGHVQYGVTVYPDWFYAHQDFFAHDFYGELTSQISFENDLAWSLVARFYKAAVEHFSAWKEIYGFAIGVQSELEIKYGQSGYRWRDYSLQAIEAFKRETGHEAPIPDFPRSIISPQIPMESFHAWMSFRERALVTVVERLAKVIRVAGHRALGYFGEFFTSHDAISAVGVIGDFADCLDAIVVDFNFFDGWRLDAEVWKVPLMANYAKTLGYKKVFGGFYVERWRQPVGEVGAPTNPAVFPIVARSIQQCRASRLIDGIEIGGFGDPLRDVEQLRTTILGASISQEAMFESSAQFQFTVGLLGSHATFNWFIGEHSCDRNIHADALTRSYELLSSVGGFSVVVLSEKSISRKPHLLDTLDAVYVPHQPMLSNNLRATLRIFAFQNTKLLIQDVRYGEWTTDGASLGGWSNDLFGISGIGWRSGGSFTYHGTTVTMPEQPRLYASHALLATRSGGELLMHSNDGDGGLLLVYQNTMTLGYIPALIEGRNADVWREAFIREICFQLRKRRRRC